MVIRCASIPETPTNVDTTVIDGYSVITWTAPYDGGSPITAYEILIRHDDNVQFDQDLVNCDGTDATIV